MAERDEGQPGVLTLAAVPIGRAEDASPRLAAELARATVIAFSPGTAGRAGLQRLADAVRRTVGGSAGSAGAAAPGARVSEVADAGPAATAEAGDDQRDLATDGA